MGLATIIVSFTALFFSSHYNPKKKTAKISNKVANVTNNRKNYINININCIMGDDGWNEVVSTKNKDKTRKKQSETTTSGSDWSSSVPLSVEYIARTSQNTQFEPFMLLLMGLPGSGKSTFARALEQAMPYKFVRINQDELGSRKRCEAEVKEVLKAGKCPIVDRCNFDESQRATWFGLAQTSDYPVDGIVLHVPVEECVRRCQGRSNHETVSPEDAAKVIGFVKSQWKPPTGKEGQRFFRSLVQIKDGHSFNDTILHFLNQM